MKTYAQYGTCRRHQGSAFPVRVAGKIHWASLNDLRAMKQVGDEVAFASMPDRPEFDRVLTLVSDGESWGVRCLLSRDYPGEWPDIELAEYEAKARADLARRTAQYESAEIWVRRVAVTA